MKHGLAHARSTLATPTSESIWPWLERGVVACQGSLIGVTSRLPLGVASIVNGPHLLHHYTGRQTIWCNFFAPLFDCCLFISPFFSFFFTWFRGLFEEVLFKHDYIVLRTYMYTSCTLQLVLYLMIRKSLYFLFFFSKSWPLFFRLIHKMYGLQENTSKDFVFSLYK